jgi:acyl-CoA synthetase (AMP-forming)/AMP-acid ligase II
MPPRRNGANLNIANGIRDFAVGSAQAVAVVDGDRTLNYATLNERASRLGNALVADGLRPDDRVAVVLGNRLEYPEVAAGLGKVGMASVPVNPRLTAPEMTFILQHSGASAVILDDALAGQVGPGIEALGLRHVYSMGGTTLGKDYEQVLARAPATDAHLDVDEGKPFTIAYTAGTTGRPKGVMISHRSRCLTFYLSALDWGLGPMRRTIAVAPMYHGAGFAFAYAAVHTGGTVSMLRAYDPERLLDMVEDFKAHSIFLVPAHIQALRALGDDVIRRNDTSSLEVVYVNAAPMPQELKIWFTSTFPKVGLYELYGSTEASIVTCLRPPDQLRKQRCVGPPWFMTEVRLLDLEKNPVRQGERGELYSRSPLLFSGYLDDLEATTASTTEDGFFSAGDVATMDDENYVYIVDRVKDMILSGGVNVYPREVEEVLHSHPGVADVAVVGQPDEKWGERVVAVVVARGTPPKEEDLIAFCRTQLAGFKLPKEVVFVPALPRNAAGKVLKRDLRESLASK